MSGCAGDRRAPGDRAKHSQHSLGNRPRFRFTLTAVIQLLLVAVAVLVTSISYRCFRIPVLFRLLAAVVLTIITRQLIPRLLSRIT